MDLYAVQGWLETPCSFVNTPSQHGDGLLQIPPRIERDGAFSAIHCRALHESTCKIAWDWERLR